MSESNAFAWWQTSVIYQIYPRSFRDTTGNGVGDLSGILEKLDYLKHTLGVDAFWISPFYPSPMADFGYDVSNYTDVDPLFGDLATFDAIVEKAHALGLKIIIDFVPNHSSDQHPWFTESRSSRDNPKRDWYVWADAKPDGGPPNNWVSVFGGSAWTWDATTEQYYLHSFLKEQPDLNWRNPDVKAAMLDAMRFWLDRGIDGFRIDVGHFMMKDPEMQDNPPNPKRGTAFKDMGGYDDFLHIYDKAHPDIHSLYREVRAMLDSYGAEQPRFAVGEIHEFDWEVWASYYGEDLDELHMPFNFSLLFAEWTPESIREKVEGLEAAIPDGAWPNYVLGNHDERRLATRYGFENVRLAAMLLLTLRGTPTLYYGDELGIEEVAVPPEKVQDPWGKNVPGLGRDGCRTPMAWDNSPSAGFSDAAPEDFWLPLHPTHAERNVETELADPNSVLNLYRRLLEVRHAHPALQCGSYATHPDVPASCYGYIRTWNGETCLVLLNFSDQEVSWQHDDLNHAKVLVSTNRHGEGNSLRGTVALEAHGGCMLTLQAAR